MNNNNPSMFDGRFVITMVLVIAFWVGWQAYLSKKYPDAYKNKNAQTIDAAKQSLEKSGSVSEAAIPRSENVATLNGQDTQIFSSPAPIEEKFTFEDDIWKFEISSRGMALKSVRLKKYSDRKGEPISFSAEEGLSLFGTGLIGRRELLNFKIRRTADNEFVGIAQVDGMNITKIMQVKSDLYSIETKVRTENPSDNFVGLVTQFTEKIEEKKGGFFLMPSFEHQEFYANHDGTSTRTMVAPDTAHSESFVQTYIAGFGSQYFAVAIVDNSPVLPEFKANTILEELPKGLGSLSYSMLNQSANFNLDYVSFMGPKSYDLLKSVDADLTNLINFGFFTSFAKGILWLMKTLQAAVGNWGLAIIFLTIIVRIVVLPFNMIGYKQMKAMSKIQPEMKLIREKYKGDPQKLNQEMMRVMKDAKANPLGGCLPMMVQIPVFFALYQVIGQSIDLYQAPFIFWIQDLSLKDPFYVLPILMGITMFVQQKITPSTLEPAQQKIMNILPIIFTFLMVTLPSGLTLYIFISTAFGVIQQVYFMKDKNDQVIATAKA